MPCAKHPSSMSICGKWDSMSSSSIVVEDWVLITTAHARPIAKALSTIAYRSMSTTVYIPSWRRLTHTEYLILTSSPREDAPLRHIMPCSFSKYSELLSCRSCQRSSRLRSRTTDSLRNSMRFGTTSPPSPCSRTGTTHSRYVRRRSNSSPMECSISRPVLKSNGCSGPWRRRSTPSRIHSSTHRRNSAHSTDSWPISISAISPSSIRSLIPGPSTSSSRSCRSTGFMRSLRTMQPFRTSPATLTAKSRSMSPIRPSAASFRSISSTRRRDRTI